MHDWGSTWETNLAPTTQTHTETMASLRVKRRRRPNVQGRSWCLPHGTRPDCLPGCGVWAWWRRSTRSIQYASISIDPEPNTPET
jgi:hypothetical protein